MVDAPTGTKMAAVAEEQRPSEPDDCVMAAAALAHESIEER